MRTIHSQQAPLFQFDNKGLEERADNDNAIIIVADNMKQAVKQKGKFTVTTTFGTPQIESAAMLPPYNPFIIINALNERGKELHLPNYVPTKRADSSHFGKGNDLTDESQQMYYISKDNMPYAYICLTSKTSTAQMKAYELTRFIRISQIG